MVVGANVIAVAVTEYALQRLVLGHVLGASTYQRHQLGLVVVLAGTGQQRHFITRSSNGVPELREERSATIYIVMAARAHVFSRSGLTPHPCLPRRGSP
jgi:hypothetical protein